LERRAGRQWWVFRDVTDADLALRLQSSVADSNDGRDFVEFSFGLRDEESHLGVTGVAGSRQTWLGLLGGYISDDGAAKLGDDCALFAAFKETAK
jgi:hypothetical protein